jgi:hypothetical protein
MRVDRRLLTDGREEGNGMKRSILLGGIVGIAIGAFITFAIAHGVFELATVRAESSRSTPQSMLEPSEPVGERRATQVTHRPIRPGSTSRGAVHAIRGTQS